MIVHVVGARPQFVKLKSVYDALDKLAPGKQRVVHTGQHYDFVMSEVFFQELDIPRPDINLGVGSGLHHEQVAAMLGGLGERLRTWDVEVVVVYGDTNSTLAGALAANMCGIPCVHVEAGMRARRPFMPEERNRLVTDHLCQRLYAASGSAMENLRKEGLAGRSVFVGDTMLDTLMRYREGLKPPGGEYYLATIHRAENTDDPVRLRKILRALESLPLEVVFPVHPRTRKAIESCGWQMEGAGGVLRWREPVGYLQMLALVKGAKKVITDSGGLQKEAYYLRTPCVTVRSETEWPETVADGANWLVECEEEVIREVVLRPVEEVQWGHPYGCGEAGVRIAEDIVGRLVGSV